MSDAAEPTVEDGNPQHRHGHHRYSLERYGLTREHLDDALADYLGRFGASGGGGRP